MGFPGCPVLYLALPSSFPRCSVGIERFWWGLISYKNNVYLHGNAQHKTLKLSFDFSTLKRCACSDKVPRYLYYEKCCGVFLSKLLGSNEVSINRVAVEFHKIRDMQIHYSCFWLLQMIFQSSPIIMEKRTIDTFWFALGIWNELSNHSVSPQNLAVQSEEHLLQAEMMPKKDNIGMMMSWAKMPLLGTCMPISHESLKSYRVHVIVACFVLLVPSTLLQYPWHQIKCSSEWKTHSSWKKINRMIYT